MMKRLAAALLVGTCLATPALALQAPGASREDANMRVVPYNPLQRVRVIGTVGRATNFTYGRREHIVRVVFGEEGLWEGPASEDLKNGLKNNLPLWPRKAGQTNLVVTTEDDKGDEHAYQYVLISRATQEGDDPEATYGLVHTNFARERAEQLQQIQATVQTRRVAWRAAHALQLEAAARAKLAEDRANAPRNRHYTGQGDVAIAPVSVSDDGQQTYLRYQGAMRVPAVFTVAPDGSEQAATTSMDGETLVVHRVADELHLRLGGAVLYVWNRAYNPVGISPATGLQADPETGTSSPHVLRSLRRASLP